ncbi:helix-turn-helix transcriptional regulator [Achromobacter sp. AONIH1]|uniref:helix-turn-helix domain-containing protein n=1 Tax=Achromobacter sp. AONIH1 TaxID=1758194 RepID=UPI001319DD75
MDSKNLINRLLTHGLTQAEIQRRAGVSQSTVSHLHTGKRGKRTSFEIVQRLDALLREVEQSQPLGELGPADV